jgi:hypothetical protein
MNSYALGRIVAGEADAARFISARKSRHSSDVHCAFRRESQSPHILSHAPLRRIGIRCRIAIGCQENDNDEVAPMFPVASSYSGV